MYPLNSVDQRLLARAALVSLDRWVSEGELPPPSRYPRIDQGTAVSPDKALTFFRSLPGGQVPNHVPQLSRLDYGPETSSGILTTLPPRQGAPYPIKVSAVDSDGNEVAGIRQPDIAVPLGTYTGWNVHDPKTGVAGEVVSLAGATIPFARTAAERKAHGDPRLSIEERYASKEDYLGKVRWAAEELVAARYLLEEDVALIMEQSSQRWDLFTSAK